MSTITIANLMLLNFLPDMTIVRFKLVSGARVVVCDGVQSAVEQLLVTSDGGAQFAPLPEGNGMNPVVNIRVEFTKLGSFSYTSTEAASEPEPTAVTPPYTFPKPVAAQEPDAIGCMSSL